MLEDDVRLASAPLFAEGSVDVLEWSFDTAWTRTMPKWADALLDLYASEGRLLGHGVHFSPLSAAWESRQERWLDRFAAEVARRRYRRISEHFGFMTAPPFTRGAPLPPPRSTATLAVGHDRLARLQTIATCPLGLENLALAWNRGEALAHGGFLESLLERDGFLVLDVHNLHCQLVNFDIGVDEALDGFPLALVREIHVSGGSELPAWPNESLRVRCDTHDDRVPEPVFALLARALDRCPNVDAVIFERLGGTLRDDAAAEAFRSDFQRVRAIARTPRAPLPTRVTDARSPTSLFTDDTSELARMQSTLLGYLAHLPNEASMRAAMACEAAFEPYRSLFDALDGRSLGIASRVTKKYGRRAVDAA